ncbi:hypothetical protein K493DRAFT_306087 [Basidiobolus meristosporus CBS 931.73]|uniref:Aminoglycoside phosphotransferase domain-containing protein n=1 Tax=Basidiobolus meristosporus CBS 931.73 TaxID=1314790 RepID=A0A1Y1XTM8_9FUNG|nr:hypothetical protein K493DRAFT_306087 [Basidiobolus meristosporus CBS 931.73]|eukprot:ORX89063.1 hypothetical protein K493DRAFT_306087 [Basidiobolus meristosporus CBS 931.73]
MSHANDLIDPVSYLNSTLASLGSFSHAQKLTGGLINYVWRVQLTMAESGASKSVIIKQSLPYLSSNPEIKFSQERTEFEARALSFFSGRDVPAALSLPVYLDDSVRQQFSTICVPEILHYDQEKYVIVMQDMGDHPNIQKWLNGLSDDPSRAGHIGKLLGLYMAQIHLFGYRHWEQLSPTFDNLPSREVLADVVYGGVEGILENAEIPDSAAIGQLAREFGQSVIDRNTPNAKALTFGDFWSGSVYIDECISGTKSNPYLSLIDWEFFGYSSPGIEISHFAVHIFLIGHTSKDQLVKDAVRALLQEFFMAYVASTKDTLDMEELYESCCTHFGLELIIEGASGNWCDAGEGKKLSAEARAILDIGLQHLRKGNPQELIMTKLIKP